MSAVQFLSQRFEDDSIVYVHVDTTSPDTEGAAQSMLNVLDNIEAGGGKAFIDPISIEDGDE